MQFDYFYGSQADTADEALVLSLTEKARVDLMAKYGVTEQDAFAMCRQEGLLSPLYEYSHRGGC